MKVIQRCLNKEIVFAALLICYMIMAAAVCAADGDGIVGVWNNEERDSRIEIFKCGNKYCGKVVWMDEPVYTDKDTDGRPGEPRVDTKNPDPALRSRPVQGLQILYGFTFAGGNRWTGGKVYDPKSGNTYSGNMTLVTRNQLHLRGYVGISLFGRTATWTRAGGE